MSAYTIKAVPTLLYRQLKARAVRHERTLEEEVLTLLEKTVATIEAGATGRPSHFGSKTMPWLIA